MITSNSTKMPTNIVFTGLGSSQARTVPCAPWEHAPVMRREPTVFEQVYGTRRNRPTTISSSVQWTPIVQRSATARWSGSDFGRPQSDRHTSFGYRSTREWPQPKAVTPPSSDYTDAYLNAFAPKPIPTRNIHRLNTPTFARVRPVVFRATQPIRTSEYPTNDIRCASTLHSFNRCTAQVDRSTSSSPSTYKPSVAFQSAPVPMPIKRPATLLFQHDEDLHASSNVKPSPILTPLPQLSPVTRTERLTLSSKPIQILETTLNRYDSIISQITDVLASVSPLSSTVSSLSSGRSVLDYELSSDTSPTLTRDISEKPSLSPSPNTSRLVSNQRTKPSHLIRGESYDKIITAIADLDVGLTSLVEEGELPSSKTVSTEPELASETNPISEVESDQQINTEEDILSPHSAESINSHETICELESNQDTAPQQSSQSMITDQVRH